MNALGVGSGLCAFLWTEPDFGKYFVNEPVTFQDPVGNWVTQTRPVEKRRGRRFMYNDVRRLYDMSEIPPIKSAIIAYNFRPQHGEFSWLPRMRVGGGEIPRHRRRNRLVPSTSS